MSGGKCITTRVRGYAPWNPRGDAKALLANVQDILREYDAYLPMTCRQVFYLFYRLVGSYDFPKTESAYKGLCEKLNRARRADMLDWDSIRDDGWAESSYNFYDGPDDLFKAICYSVENYRRDPMIDQPRRLGVLCEAAGMKPMLEQVCRPYGVPVLTSGGFDSVTIKHSVAVDKLAGEYTLLLHIGDYDPAACMSSNHWRKTSRRSLAMREP